MKKDKNKLINNGLKLEMKKYKAGKEGNTLIVGATEKIREKIIIKEILLKKSSYVITDTSGKILKSTRKSLEKAGYDIKVLDLMNLENSNHYNPFNYLRDDADVYILTNCLIENGYGGFDPFRENPIRALVRALIFYVKDHKPQKDHNFTTIISLLKMAFPNYERDDKKSALDLLFEEIEKSNNYDDYALRNYKEFKILAGKKNLINTLVNTAITLDVFNISQFAALTSSVKNTNIVTENSDETWIDNIQMDTVGDKKTALFIITPINDNPFNFLSNIMYAQLFESLFYKCEKQYKGSLPVPVRFFPDETINIPKIPHFVNKLACMKKYGMNCTIISKDFSYVEAKYKEFYGGIISNCYNEMYLKKGEY